MLRREDGLRSSLWIVASAARRIVGLRSTSDPPVKDFFNLDYVSKTEPLPADESEIRARPAGPPPGSPSTLVVGKWNGRGRTLWEFRGNGTFDRWDDLPGFPANMPKAETGTYRFLGDGTLETTDTEMLKNAPQMRQFAVKQYDLVFYGADELRVKVHNPLVEQSLNTLPLLKRGK